MTVVTELGQEKLLSSPVFPVLSVALPAAGDGDAAKAGQGGKKQTNQESQAVQTHFEVQRPEFGSVNYFTNVLVSLIEDQGFLSKETVC